MNPRFSVVVPCRNQSDPKLLDLIKSVRGQDFPQESIEIIVVSEGDSESAKAIGIRKAKGDILAMCCADNFFTNKLLFQFVSDIFRQYNNITGVYSKFYEYYPKDSSLNRYFSLIGNNDPIPFYLGKCDRKPWYEKDPDSLYEAMQFNGDIPSLGDNGFFVWREHMLEADLDNYYPMDSYVDMKRKGLNNFIRYNDSGIWHRTSDTFLKFLIKRYKYARDLYCDRSNRRWKMVDGAKDICGLVLFALATLTIAQPLYISIRGYRHVRDRAWFWHPIVCWGHLITYGVLTIRWLMVRSLSRLWEGLRRFKTA